MRKILSIVAGTILLTSCKHADGVFCENLEEHGLVKNCKTYANGKLVQIEELGPGDIYHLRRDGPFIQFSSDGKDTLVNAYYRDGKLIGNYYEYYSNGRPKIYRCFDSFHEDTMFYRSYNERGEVVKERGKLTFYTSMNPYDSLAKDTVKFGTVVLSIPKTTTSVNIFLVDSTKQKDTIQSVANYFEPFQGNLIYMTCFVGLQPNKYIAYYETSVNDSAVGKTYRNRGHINFQR